LSDSVHAREKNQGDIQNVGKIWSVRFSDAGGIEIKAKMTGGRGRGRGRRVNEMGWFAVWWQK
jgi:hypothetical protein